jgi:hypothetical protein
MKRPLGVVVSAVILALLSMLQVLAAMLVAWAGVLLEHPDLTKVHPGAPPHPPVPGWMPIFIYALCGIFLAIAVWGITTAIGLHRLRRWARYSILVIGGFLAMIELVSLLTSLLLLVMPLAPAPSGDPSRAVAVHGMIRVIFGILAFFHASMLALGVFWLVYFNRKNVREVFDSGLGAQAESRRPLIIALIAVLQMIGAPLCLLAAILPFPVLILGFMLSGWEKAAAYLAMAALQAAGGVGLWRMQEWGRRLMMGFQVFGIVQCAVVVARPSLYLRYSAEFNRSMNLELNLRSQQLASHFQTIASVGTSCISILIFLAILWVLHHYRARFDQSTGPPQIEPIQTA